MRGWLPFAAVLASVVSPAAVLCDSPWKEYRSTEGGFKVLMPGVPKVEQQKLEAEGEPPLLHVHLLKGQPHNFMLVYGDFPKGDLDNEDREKVVDKIRDAFVESLKGKVVSETPIKLGLNPGRDLRVDGPDMLAVRSRIFLIKDRLYHITAFCATDKIGAAPVAKFLDSFKLLSQ